MVLGCYGNLFMQRVKMLRQYGSMGILKAFNIASISRPFSA